MPGIKAVARDNSLWGAERIRGELLKLDIRVSKRTIQKYLRQVPRSRPAGQRWAPFLRHRARETRAGDFLPVTDLLFRPPYAFFIVELGSRRVVHLGVTRHPTDERVAQLLREATPFGEGPRFARVAAGSRIEMLRTPIRAPRANATCERFLGSVRRECLDHQRILHKRQLHRAARPHQGVEQAIPDAAGQAPPSRPTACAGWLGTRR